MTSVAERRARTGIPHPKWRVISKRFPMDEIRYEVLHTDLLRVAGYQRPPVPRLCAAIAQEFDPLLAGTLVISHRDNAFWVVDGQQRLIGARSAGQASLACLVVEGLTYEYEAQVFGLLNDKRVAVSAVAKFKAAVEGQEPWAMAIVGIVTNRGGMIRGVGGRGSATGIKAVDALRTIYLRSGPERLDMILALIGEAFGELSDVTATSRLLRGLEVLIAAEHPKLNWDRFTKKLAASSNDEIDKLARRFTVNTNTSGRATYLALLEIYNKGTRSKIEPKAKIVFKKEESDECGD
jgi:hypothetical protein